MSFGADLRRERELRGISLDEISKETKIGVRLLEAMELDRFDLLPGGVFRKAFLRNYASYIGLNEEKVLQDYALQVEGERTAPVQEVKILPTLSSSSTDVPASQSVKVVLILLLVIMVLTGSVWYLQRCARKNQETQEMGKSKEGNQHPVPPPGQPSSPKETQPVSSPGVAPATTADSAMSPGSANSPSSPVNTTADLKVLGELAKKPKIPVPAPGSKAVTEKAPGELALKVVVLQETWVSVESGDTTLYSGLLLPEQIKTFSLQRPLKITAGNAGGVRLSVNNKLLLPMGKLGEVRVLVINAENYPQLLAPGL